MSDPNEIYGPPQDNPYERLTDEQRARLDRALAIADGVQFYRQAGGMGAAAQWAPHARALESQGGLTPEQATELARYRMFKQGMQPPLGPREPAQTDQDKLLRNKNFLEAPPEIKKKMWDEDAMTVARSAQGYFDSLVQKPKDAIVDETKPAKKVADAE